MVEGPTLADRISKGPIPLDETLPIAKQIAEALEAAHEAGVIHRDLKPANIKVRDDGTVKVLDFGLAKALDTTPEGDPSQSPTLTAAATQMGVIMGTAAYMAPEQARGSTADRRADIWAFGVVLYEMLTGRRLFEGTTVSDTLAAVLRAEPDWTALPADTPVAVRRLLGRCLERDRQRRLQHVGDARLEIDDGLAHPATENVATPSAIQPFGQWRPWSVVVPAFVAGAAIAGLAVWGLTRSEPQGVPRFPIYAELYTSTIYGDVAISPDGEHIAFTVRYGDGLEVRRSLDQLAPPTVVGDGQPYNPFFSPDGEWIGFYDVDANALKRVRVRGGPTVTITDLAGNLAGVS